MSSPAIGSHSYGLTDLGKEQAQKVLVITLVVSRSQTDFFFIKGKRRSGHVRLLHLDLIGACDERLYFTSLTWPDPNTSLRWQNLLMSVVQTLIVQALILQAIRLYPTHQLGSLAMRD